MTEIDCKGTNALICPYCGKNQRVEHFELSDYDDSYECHYCGKEFEYERESVPYYTSKKKVRK